VKAPLASLPSKEKISTQLDKILANSSMTLAACSDPGKRPDGSKVIKNTEQYKRMYGDLYEKETSVMELKLKDFSYDKSHKILRCTHPAFTGLKRGIIIFYAPWCPHCNKIYDDIVELSLNYMNIFPIGVVNIEDSKNKNDLLTNYAEVTKYPTMKILDKEMIVRNYNNEITKDNITYYVNMNL
jgi:thiol-disulfide isomerase/thioredoxin